MKRTLKAYQKPQIYLVPLDNEISLVLSTPPWGPDEGMNQQVPEFFKNEEPLRS